MARSYGELLDALRGATWPARAPVRGTSSGLHAARVRGNAVEFAEYRPYRQGDDPRRLDWRVLARTDRAYVRVTTHRATLPTGLVVDASASMAFPARTHGKWTQACSVAVGLAAVAHGTGDPAGLIVTAERGVRAIAPRTRRDVVAGIARLLDGVTPGGSRPLAPALAAARDVSRIVVISDFLDDLDDVIAAARERASAGAELYAVHVVAPEELSAGAGHVLAFDPEHPAVRRSLTERVRGEYVAAFAAWRDEVAAAWRRMGAAYGEVLSNEPPARAVRRIMRSAAGPVA